MTADAIPHAEHRPPSQDEVEGAVRTLLRWAEHRPRPSRAEAEGAVRTLLGWIGEDPARPGLLGTPRRVTRAYEEWFGGYRQDPAEFLRTTFDETGGYDEVVLLRDVEFVSHCEHHLAPIVGRAHVAYLPDRRVVGVSKLARVVDVFARRLQIQERLTAQARTRSRRRSCRAAWRW